MSGVVVLILFAVIAGAGTALSPCVLPVLPALLSASASGGKRRPIGVVLGLALTFTVTIVGLVGFGVALLVPKLAERLEAPLARLSRYGPRSKGDGFLSGLAVGGAL